MQLSGRRGLSSLYGILAISSFLALAQALPLNDLYASIAEPLSPPTWALPAGTDELGRDVFARTLHGMAITWMIAWPIIASGIIVGGMFGVIAGLGPQWAMTAVLRLTDVFLALPAALVAITVAVALGGGLRNTMIAMAVTFWPPYTRLVAFELRSARDSSFVEVARRGGVGGVRLTIMHILPATVRPLSVQATMDIPAVILTLAALSFLGLGAAPPFPELGAMTARGLPYAVDSWWVPAFPAVGVLILSVAAALLGDRLSESVRKHNAS